MPSRLVLGTLHLPGERQANFELRDARWLADDPARALRWHDGPVAVHEGDAQLLIANDLGAAVVLHGLNPATVQRGARGTGILLEAAREPDTGCQLDWTVIEVVD
ncbi:hypothetical protein [Caldimonas brevitalea]|uniref:Uncharacterized protein n=1 Tax=Caldimonas brevitalea TaxID=413882 RepID=A0A0G3BNR5_9BURK|nr:hypothetical protein [Caldimonas brevitalea]AKJ28190.1 hypothetical protein AAW51_1499 [Caldimonas brevitalea]